MNSFKFVLPGNRNQDCTGKRRLWTTLTLLWSTYTHNNGSDSDNDDDTHDDGDDTNDDDEIGDDKDNNNNLELWGLV